MDFNYIAERVWLIRVKDTKFLMGGVTVKNNYILTSAEGAGFQLVGRRIRKRGYSDLSMVYVRSDLGLMILKCEKTSRTKFKHAVFAENEIIRKGEEVYHIGNPDCFVSSAFTSCVGYPCKMSHEFTDSSVKCGEYKSNTERDRPFCREYRIMGDHFYSYLFNCEKPKGPLMPNPNKEYYKSLESTIPIIQCVNICEGSFSLGGPLFRKNGTLLGIFSHFYDNFDIALHASVLKTFMKEAKDLGLLPKQKGIKKSKTVKDKETEKEKQRAENVKQKTGSNKRKAEISTSVAGIKKKTKPSKNDAGDKKLRTGVGTGISDSFKNHLNYQVRRIEASNLAEEKSEHKWKFLAIPELPNCRWKGIGKHCMKEFDLESSSDDIMPILSKHWVNVFKKSEGQDFPTSIQRYFHSLYNSYLDIMHPNKNPFYRKGAEEEVDGYLMHSLNHIFKTRALVKKNDAGTVSPDQGFTRPKILILLPFRSIALRVVKRLIQLTPPVNEVNVENIDRFYKEFGPDVEDSVEDNDGANLRSKKPADFEALFGGNSDDNFMVGIKFTRRSIKLHVDFISSDMIIASPLSLATNIAEAREDNGYLSSIEVVILDHADIIKMENWYHVNKVFEQLNFKPPRSVRYRDANVRIRRWYKKGRAKFYRQNIILSSYTTPEINALFNSCCFNHQGKVKLVPKYKGVFTEVVLQVQQTFERFDACESNLDDARYMHFTDMVFPMIKQFSQGGVMIFINSDTELCRIRGFLTSKKESFCLVDESQVIKDIYRPKIMLYTERSHFHQRYKIRGIQELFFYSLPDSKEFYLEIVNMLEGVDCLSCNIPFSRFDKLRLQGIVGTETAKEMIRSEEKKFEFF